MVNTSLLSLVLLATSVTVFTQALKLTTDNPLYSPLNPKKVYAAAGNAGALQNGWYPDYTTPDTGKWVWTTSSDRTGWASGFFPSMLYLMAERERLCPGTAPNVDWTSLARSWSTPLLKLQTQNTLESAIGMAAIPFQHELDINPNNATARAAVLNFADTLARRFDSGVGAIRSWEPSGKDNVFSVSIDEMMNIQVLMAAHRLTQNNTLKVIATTHADTTIKNHLRSDGGSYHFIDYNATTGAIIDRKFSDKYSWARGQAWALLGFLDLYEQTKIEEYLATSRNLASYIANTLPANKIMPWNLNSTNKEPADSSAAMIASYAFARFSYLDNVKNLDKYWNEAAGNILTLNGRDAWKRAAKWESLLANGTMDNSSNPPNKETGTVWGDYYWLQMGNFILKNKWLKCE